MTREMTLMLTICGILLLVAGCSGGGEPAVEIKKPPSPPASSSKRPSDLVGTSVRDFPDTGLINQDSHPVSFEGLPSKPVVMSFIYTRCPMKSMCPKVTRQMATIQDRVNKQGKKPAHFVLITFDPRYDRPDVLRRYAEKYDISFQNFSLWTGPSPTIKDVTDQFRIMVKKKNGQPAVHNMKTYLIDRNGVIRHRFLGSDWRVNEVMAPLMRMVSKG